MILWNAHIPSLTITARYQFFHLGEVRHAWSSYLAQGSYIVSQLAVLRFTPTTCIFRVPCAIHLATMSHRNVKLCHLSLFTLSGLTLSHAIKYSLCSHIFIGYMVMAHQIKVLADHKNFHFIGLMIIGRSRGCQGCMSPFSPWHPPPLGLTKYPLN